MLATVLFADIVDSTAIAARMGDQAWSARLDEWRARLASLVRRFAGREVDSVGDGYFAAFDGPGRAINCALACVDAAREFGFEIRVGLHTGECEQVDDQLRGLAVHIGARVMATAAPSEVVVSRSPGRARSSDPRRGPSAARSQRWQPPGRVPRLPPASVASSLATTPRSTLACRRVRPTPAIASRIPLTADDGGVQIIGRSERSSSADDSDRHVPAWAR